MHARTQLYGNRTLANTTTARCRLTRAAGCLCQAATTRPSYAGTGRRVSNSNLVMYAVRDLSLACAVLHVQSCSVPLLTDHTLTKAHTAPAGTPVLTWPSGHINNVFQARFMPHTDNTTLVSCAADGQVGVCCQTLLRLLLALSPPCPRLHSDASSRCHSTCIMMPQHHTTRRCALRRCRPARARATSRAASWRSTTAARTGWRSTLACRGTAFTAAARTERWGEWLSL